MKVSAETPEWTIDRRDVIEILAGFAVGLFLLYVFGRTIGWQAILHTLGRTNLWLFALACLLTTVCLAAWAKGWGTILGTLNVDVPYHQLVVTYFAAMFANYLTPFGRAGGGPFAAYVVSSNHDATFEDGLASIASTNVLTAVPYFAFSMIGVVALVIIRQLSNQARVFVGILAFFAVLIPLLAYYVISHENHVEDGMVRLLGPLSGYSSTIDEETIRDRVQEFYDHVDRITDDRSAMIHMITYSFVGWLFFLLPLFIAALSLGVVIPVWLVFFIVPASTLATLLPTPGGLGGVEALMVTLLVSLMAMQPQTAAAVTLVYRLASYWFVIATGGVVAAYLVYWS
jgi:uncharacterized protein (TIRG00374 family)